jgi:hypothetical protein
MSFDRGSFAGVFGREFETDVDHGTSNPDSTLPWAIVLAACRADLQRLPLLRMNGGA